MTSGWHVRADVGPGVGMDGVKRTRLLVHLACMTRAEFERLVRQAVADIPDWIHAHVDNVDVVVDDWPSREQLVGSGID